MAKVRAQTVDEELSEGPSFYNPKCLVIGSPMLYPTELKSQDTIQLERTGIMGKKHLGKWGNTLDIPCSVLKHFL